MKHTDKGYVELCVKTHMAAFEDWPHGPMKEAWTDKDGYLCIRYTSGKHWHYKEENGQIIWW